MLIPVKCYCGKVIADKYRYYVEEVRRRKVAKSMHVDKVQYMTREFAEITPEAEVLDEIGITKQCCRVRFLTHVDIE